jgi:transposase InsO family protein
MHISRYGIPDKLMSDNGPQYDNHHFKKFIAEYGIEHKTSSPRYPQSNGYAERAVQTANKILSTAQQRKAMKIHTLHCLVIAIHHVIAF